PRLHDALLVARVHRLHALRQALVDVRALLYGSRHRTLDPGLGSLGALATANDQALRWFLHVARLHALLLAPRAHHVPATARAAAVRVIHRGHDFAAALRATSLPSGLAGLAPGQQLVLGVAHLADRRQAVAVHAPRLGGRHAQGHVLAFLGDDLERHARRARDLAPATRHELHVMHVRA